MFPAVYLQLHIASLVRHGHVELRHLRAGHVHGRGTLGIGALDARAYILLLAQGA
jgi:hypothetical protein